MKTKLKENVCCKVAIPQEEYIRSKIYEANILIDRVKYTLFDIKNKAKNRTKEVASSISDREGTEILNINLISDHIKEIKQEIEEEIGLDVLNTETTEESKPGASEPIDSLVEIHRTVSTEGDSETDDDLFMPTNLETTLKQIKRNYSAPTGIISEFAAKQTQNQLNDYSVSSDKEKVNFVKRQDDFKNPDNIKLKVPRRLNEDSVSSDDEYDDGVLHLKRPKTRRNKSSSGPVDIRNRYKSTPSDMDEDLGTDTLSNFEYMRGKLNTINEQTETNSDMSSSISEIRAVVDKAKGTAVTAACNTDDIEQKSEATQEKPFVHSIGTQVTQEIFQKSVGVQKHNVTASVGVQNIPKTMETFTEMDNKREMLSADTTVIEITPTKQKLTHHLIVQILPQINICGGLVTQKVQHFYIDHKNTTHMCLKNKAKNVGFLSVSAENRPNEDLSRVVSVTFDLEKDEPPIENIMSSREKISSTESIAPSVDNEIAEKPKNSSHGDIKSQQKKRHKSVSDSELFIKDLFHKLSKKFDDLESVTTEESKEACSDKQLVLQSYQLYDNPDSHDPGQLNANVDFDMLSNIDMSVYKTFINPDGLPPPRYPTSNERTNNGKSNSGINHAFVNPATLDKISSFRLFNPNKKTTPPTTDMYNVPQPSVSSSTPMQQQSLPSIINPIISQPMQEQNSKLWDIGLYSSKSVQVDESLLPTSEVESKENLIKDANIGKDENIENYVKEDNVSNSFEKISLTMSYSTDETVTTESSEENKTNTDIHLREFVNQNNEKELRTIEPEATNHEGELSDKDTKGELFKKKLSQVSHLAEGQQTFRLIRDKLNKDRRDRNTLVEETLVQRNIQLSNLCSEDLDNISRDTTVNQFIGELTKSTTSELRKVIPQIRRTVGKSKDSSPSTYTMMPVQMNDDKMCGDTVLNDLPHLKLGANGRYKDEEDLFCENSYPKYKDIPLRKTTFKYVPKHYCIKKHTLDTSTSDTVTMEESISDGEVKCQCSASIGELHNCKYKNTLSNTRQLPFSDKMRNPRVSIRERRTYFNNWITYYVNRRPLSIDNSSSSNDKSVT